MCGINAVYDPGRTLPDRDAIVAGMNREMAYRGPDGEGRFSYGPVTLGMRRLSIIDLEGGFQPLFNEDRSVALVCNGEIYNHVERRAELVARGHRYATGSDCETILHLYEERGERCVDALRGMFAFVLWDTRTSRLVAARDRLGIKPLYLAERGRRLAFSSELKTLIGAGLASTSLDHDALYRTLRHTFPVDERRTLATDVDRVAPGELIVADAGGVRRRRYWAPAFAAGSASLTDEDLGRTLEEAVAIHLRSDVPVAVLLSAGIDSAAIAAMASRGSGEVVGLSAGYTGAHACDEREGAQATARALGMRCLEVELDAGEFSRLFVDLAKRCDEPACDIASMAQWALYRSCRALGYKVVLSGIGGDEIFFGYPVWNRAGEQLARRAWFDAAVPGVVASGARRAGRLLPRLRDGLGSAWPGAFTGLVGVSRTHERALRWLGADPDGRRREATDEMVLALERRAAPGPDATYAFLAGAYLPNNGFQLADKLGMGNSIEVRVPFADHVLFERVVGLPLTRRFSRREGKPLLKRLLGPYLPREVLERPKRGFTPPSFFVRAIVEEHADAVLSSPALDGFVDAGRLRAIVDAYLSEPHEGAPARRAPTRARRLADRGRAFVDGGFSPRDAGWLLYGLTALVKSMEAWRPLGGEARR